MIKRWKIEGTPHGLAVLGDIAYVGLAGRQSIVAFDLTEGAVLTERVLDRAEIASTKEIVSLRPTADGKRLVAANGSDESVTIVSIPDLVITREIGLEGEMIRDAVPDPAGRYLFILGSSVHIYDFAGEKELRTLPDESPMTIAVSDDGALLAVVSREKFESGAASVVTLYDLTTLKEMTREPLQTDRSIRAAIFAAGNRSLVVLADDWLAEKGLVAHPGRRMAEDRGRMRLTFDFRDLISSETICLAPSDGPQIATLGRSSTIVHFAEKRCKASGSVTAAPRQVASASLYAVPAFAIAYDASRNAIVATDPAGYLTIYKSPQPSPRH